MTRLTAAMVLLALGFPAVSTAAGVPSVEHIIGVYEQQTIETATAGGREILLTRMTRFERCGGRRPIAQAVNGHTVEVLGRSVPGIGFVAGIVNVIEGCGQRAFGLGRPGGAP